MMAMVTCLDELEMWIAQNFEFVKFLEQFESPSVISYSADIYEQFPLFDFRFLTHDTLNTASELE